MLKNIINENHTAFMTCTFIREACQEIANKNFSVEESLQEWVNAKRIYSLVNSCML